ncbi:MAG: PIN domain-containing protein [Coriobacteriia bacterium]|nr:PIN domain-containing protein [Coriobacteriia bacterium]
MRLVDTNVILRYVLGDDKDLSPKAREIIQTKDVEVSVEVIAEVVYVLQSVYKVPRDAISESLAIFLTESGIHAIQEPLILEALGLYEESNISFIDCLLAAYTVVHKAEVYTFDRKLQRLINASR